jgi:hypothetical protein
MYRYFAVFSTSSGGAVRPGATSKVLRSVLRKARGGWEGRGQEGAPKGTRTVRLDGTGAGEKARYASQ